MEVEKYAHILNLSEEILTNLELNELPLSNILLKGARIARLQEDFKTLDWMTSSSKISAQHEEYITTAKIQIAAAADADVSISSSNPHQFIAAPHGNSTERTALKKYILEYQAKIQEVRSTFYKYVLNVNYQIKFSGIPSNIFDSIRTIVDNKLKEIAPESIKKFVSIYGNLKSDNHEDWSNAVHSCRRVLQELADKLYPPYKDGLEEVNVSGKKIKIGPDNYINRLMLYVSSKSESQNFQGIVGSSLNYMGDRLDSIYRAANKGSHILITDIKEAERYIIYTYLLLGDVLSL